MATRLVILKSGGTLFGEGMGTSGHWPHIGELILTQISKTQTLVSLVFFPNRKKKSVGCGGDRDMSKNLLVCLIGYPNLVLRCYMYFFNFFLFCFI